MKVKSYEEMNKEVNDIWSIKDPIARKEALVAKAVRSARTINQGFKRMADADINYNDTAYRYANKNLVMNQKEGLNTVSTSKKVYQQMTAAKLRSMLLKMNDIRASDTSRVSTIQRVYGRRLRGSLSKLKDSTDINPTFDDLIDQYEFFLKHGGGDLMNDYGSTGAELIYNDWLDFMNRESKKTKKQLNKEFLENYGYFKIIKGDRYRVAKNKPNTVDGVRLPLNVLAKRLKERYNKKNK